jgi:hypothetical protein
MEKRIRLEAVKKCINPEAPSSGLNMIFCAEEEILKEELKILNKMCRLPEEECKYGD